MDVVVVSEHRLVQLPDGTVFGESGYDFWSRYLEVFDTVRLVCRVEKRQDQVTRLVRVDGPGVTVIPVPHYVGPAAYLRVRSKVRKAVGGAFSPGAAVILRVGSNLASAMVTRLRRSGAPYGVEVVGDPHDVFAPGVVNHPLRPFFRWWFVRQQKHQCAEACAVAYVTERTLQRRYPCGKYTVGVSDVDLNPEASDNRVLSTHYSSIDLSPIDFATRIESGGLTALQLITVGSLSQLYKGVDTVIRATAAARRQGLDLRLTVVGDGKYRSYLEHLARKEGLNGHVNFTGALPGPQSVKHELDRADLFVLASRTEGLPRVLIEAMARGLSCIASNVGGIPELLDGDDLVEPDNVRQLAEKIALVARDGALRAEMSRRNFRRAQDYRRDLLRVRRLAFYTHVRATTQAWVQSRRL